MTGFQWCVPAIEERQQGRQEKDGTRRVGVGCPAIDPQDGVGVDPKVRKAVHVDAPAPHTVHDQAQAAVKQREALELVPVALLVERQQQQCLLS